MRKVFAALLLLAAVSHGSAQEAAASTDDQNRLLAMENAWNQAIQQKDANALKMLLGSELVYVNYDGTLMTREQYVARVMGTAVRPAQIANQSMTVRVYGSIAVVTGLYREKGLKNGKPYLHRERFTDTWVLRNKTWTCVASQSTQIP